MSRILFVGDPHGSLAGVLPTARRASAGHVVLLGDLEMTSKSLRQWYTRFAHASIHLWWIYGNHDWERLDHAGWLHGKAVYMDGLRVGGIDMPPGAKTGQWDDAYIQQVYADTRLDILVSHDVPTSEVSREPEGHVTSQCAYFYSGPFHGRGHQCITDIARDTGARAVFHGHIQYYEPRVCWVTDACLSVCVPHDRGIVDETGMLLTLDSDGQHLAWKHSAFFIQTNREQILRDVVFPRHPDPRFGPPPAKYTWEWTPDPALEQKYARFKQRRSRWLIMKDDRSFNRVVGHDHLSQACKRLYGWHCRWLSRQWMSPSLQGVA